MSHAHVEWPASTSPFTFTSWRFISFIFLHFLLLFTFYFLDVVDYNHAHFRWGAGSPGQKELTHKLWAQRPRHHGGLCRVHPGVRNRATVHRRLGQRRYRHRSDAPQCVPKTSRTLRRRTKVTSQVTKFWDKNSDNERFGLSWTDKESKSSLIIKRRFKSTNSRLIMTEEVFKNWVKRSSRSKKNFIVLMQKNDGDKIINFFMNSWWRATGIFVNLTRKSQWNKRIEAISGFCIRHNCKTKINRGSGYYSGTYRNCKKKLVVWMTQEINKVLNQYAVEILTSPVNSCLSHLVQFLVEC